MRHVDSNRASSFLVLIVAVLKLAQLKKDEKALQVILPYLTSQENDFVAKRLFGVNKITCFEYLCIILLKGFIFLFASVVDHRKSSLVPSNHGNELSLAISL